MMDAECTDLNEAESRAAQKENVYLDGEGTVFHRWDQSSSGLSGKKVSGQDQLHITPSKPEEWVNSEPLTPTTNLKLLINAAIPDIRVREMRKILFGPLENENTEARLDKCSQFEAVDEEAGEFDQKPSRKQKSLGLLCQKFLALYPNNPSPSETISISLDEVATNLGVERRRIYDIVNVLESLKLVSRVAKNQYVWHGRRTLKRTLQELHALGQRQSYHLQMERAAHCNLGPSVQTERLPESCEDGDEDASLGPVGTRKDKSLRIMSQKFITLFLVSRTRVITLELAAKILIEEHQGTANHSKYKTKVRRLYDIANVLTSLDLIAKVHVKEERGRKPAFKWTGPMDFLRDRDVDTVAGLSPPEFHGAPRQTSQGTRPRLLSLSPFDIVPVPPQERVISVPGSPNRGVMGLMQEIVGASQKVEDGAAACHMQAGDGKRNQPYVYPKCGLLLSQAGSVHPEPSGSIPLDRLYSSSSPSSGPLLSLSPSPQGEVGESGPHVALPYFLGLSQAPVFMLCGGLAATEPGASPGSELKVGILGKRRTEDISGRPSKRDRKETVEASLEGDEDQAMQENSLKGYSPKPMTPGPALQPQAEMWSPPSPLSSHYLYVPNSAGFNSLNLLVSPGRVAGPLSLTSSAASSLAMPLVLLQFAGTRVGIPAHMVLRGHHVASPDSSPVPTQSSNRAQCQTPKEAAPTRSPAFFRTPGTLGCTEPRGSPRRVSAQRRLDVGQPAN